MSDDIYERFDKLMEEQRKSALSKPILRGVHEVKIFEAGYSSGEKAVYNFFDEKGNRIHSVSVGFMAPFYGEASFKDVKEVKAHNGSTTIIFDGVVGCKLEEKDGVSKVLKIECGKSI